MTTKNKLIFGVAAILAFIVVAVAGFWLGQQDTLPATAQSVSRVQPPAQKVRKKELDNECETHT